MSLSIPGFSDNRKHIAWYATPLLWPLLFVLTALPALHDYIHPSSLNTLLGATAIVVCSRYTSGKRRVIPYAVAAGCFALLNVLLPVKTFLYATVAYSICFSLALHGRNISRLLPLIVVCMSSVFQYFTDVFSFPVRLALTCLAAKIMTLVGFNVLAEGNMLRLNNHAFSVDIACMGLNMLAASILLSIMAIGIYEKEYNKRLSWRTVAALVATSICFNIIANLLRIVCLVLFNIPAESNLHSITGLVCLSVYGFAPTIFIVRHFTRKSGRFIVLVLSSNPSSAPSVKMYAMQFILLALIIVNSVHIIARAKLIQPLNQLQKSLPGYSITALPNSVVKLQNDKALIYIKHIQSFYSTDHNPSICWRGSGYQFQQIKTNEVGGYSYYSAVLQKGKDQLFTAWWYDNGTIATIGQLNWRWNELHNGKHYSIVNITASSGQQLEAIVYEALTRRPFQRIIEE